MTKRVRTGIRGVPGPHRVMRDLARSELEAKCPNCGAVAGNPCTYVHNGQTGVPYAPHVERKRAYGRQRRITVVVAVLERHLPITAASTAGSAGLMHIAEEICEALGGKLAPDGSWEPSEFQRPSVDRDDS